MVFVALGIVSSIIFLIGDLPYVIDTIKGKTKPQRTSWGIIFFLNSVGFANQWASGARNSLWLFGASVIMTGAIFFASLFKGVGGHAKLDFLVLAAALVGVGLWFVFDSPAVSVVVTWVVAIFSLLPTIAKAKKHPETETKITWLLGAISTLLAAISVGKLDWQLLLLPINATILQAYMAYILYFQAKKRRSIQESEARVL